MSFSTETKNELARQVPEKKKDQLSEIAGFFRSAGSLRLAGNGKFKILASTGNPAIARHYKKLLQEYFKIEAGLEIEAVKTLNKGHKYTITISPEQNSDQILRETGILLVREGENYISDGIYDVIIRSKGEKKAYLKGQFLASGYVSDPGKSYHLEIVTSSEILAQDVKKLMNSFSDISAKIAVRRKKYVVYIKSGIQVRDMLAIIGADSQVLIFDEQMLRREMMNDTVRMTNCDNANTDRILKASEEQRNIIEELDRKIGLKTLPPNLLEVARLRMEHPEASLIQIGEMLTPKLKKSAVSDRFAKLKKLLREFE